MGKRAWLLLRVANGRHGNAHVTALGVRFGKEAQRSEDERALADWLNGCLVR